MEPHVAELDRGRACRDHYTKPDQQVRPDQPNRKRCRNGESEEPSENIYKHPRLQESLSKRRRNAGDKVQSQPSRKSPRLRDLLDLTPPCLIQTPKPVRPISTPWFLDDWLDTINHPSSHCRSRSAPCDTRGRQHRRQRQRSWSVSHSRMGQRKSFSGSIERPKSEQSDGTAQKSSALSVSAADYRSNAENHGCVWKKAGPLPQNIGHTVNGILTRPRDSPPMTDDEARRWAEISQDATESLEPNLSAAFYKAGFVPQPGHPGGTLALSQDFPPMSVPRTGWAEGGIPAPRPDCSWGYTKEAFTSYQELGRNNKYSSVKDKDTRLQRDTILPGFIWEFKSQAAQGSMYVAVNQTIGAGAACVKALTTLYEEAQKQGMVKRNEADTIAFSVAIDGQFANLNIHWFQELQYMAQRHRSYRLCEADDIPEFFNHCKNILTYLYGPRHQKIATALNTLFQATFVGDKHRDEIEKGYDAYTKARYEDIVHKYITDQKVRGIEVNGNTSTLSASYSDASTAESQIAAESQTTVSILQTPQEAADSSMEPKNAPKRRRGSFAEGDGTSRKKKH